MAADQKNIISRTRDCGAGLAALRDEHILILENIRNTEDTGGGGGGGNNASPVLEERIAAVTDSLEKLEVGVAESGVLIALAGHFERLEADRTLARLEMRRMQDENEWLREELEDTEKRLEEALSRLAGLEEEKHHWNFMNELRRSEQEADLRPITPSKIPVGAWRAEEEKAINRALNGSCDSNRDERSVSPNPTPVSRIPKIALKMGNRYKSVQEKIEKANNEREEKGRKMRGKRHKLTLTPATSHSKIPSR